MIKPIKPNKVPQMESERRMMAGFSPIAFPMMRGVRYKSWIHCTIPSINNPEPKIIQKFCPVYADFSRLRMTIGIRPIACRYGIRFSTPINNPSVTASGKPTILKPIESKTPTHSAINDCPRK